MRGEVWCVTNDVNDLRSCTIRGMHAGNCDGYARRWDVGTQMRVLISVPTFVDDGVIYEYAECRGCLPREAEHGRLCDSHVQKMRQLFALDAPVELSPGSDREALLDEMEGHVIGVALLTATYAGAGDDDEGEWGDVDVDEIDWDGKD